MFRRTLVAFSVSSLMLGVSPLAIADDEADINKAKMETMVVTGTRSENLLKNVPASVEVFTSQEIEAMGAVSVRDVISRATGAQTYAQKGGINLRGIGFNYTVVLVNGRKPGAMENNKDFQSYITQNINIDSVDRIEILRGQAGVMYGSNAIGGVINIITKQSYDASSVFTVTHGSNESKLSFTQDFGRENDIFGRVSGSYTNYIPVKEDTLDNNGSWEETDSGNLSNFNSTIGYTINESNEIRFEASYSNLDTVGKSLTYSDETLVDGDGNESTNTTYSSRESETYRKRIEGAIIFDGYTQDHTYTAGLTVNQVELSKSGYEQVYDTMVLDAQDVWQINDWNKLVIGGEYLKNEISRENIELKDDSLDRYALYLQDQVSLLDNSLILIPSLRFDDDSAFGNKVTYQFGGTYQFIENNFLKANIGTGYKAPVLTELYAYETQGSGTVWGNPNLTPEESDSWDVRYEVYLDRLKASIGYYSTDVTDKFSSKICEDFEDGSENRIYCDNLPDPINGDNKLRYNIGEASVSGIEAQLTYALTDSLNIKLSYDGIDAKQINDEGVETDLNFNSENIYGLDIQYYNADEDLGVNIWGAYNQDYLYSSSGERFDFYNFNASVHKGFGEIYSVTFAAYNLYQSERTSETDTAISPFEWRLSFSAKL
ncbi:MAG: TonB-dependent receptor [Shewanella sp.]